MKKVIIAALMAATILPQALTARAQIFSHVALGGAVLGGVAGGIIGHNSGRRTAEGIGIGVGVGLLAGSLSSNYRRHYYDGHYTRDYYYSSPYGYGRSYYRRPNYAFGGAILGGATGGIIGHNNGRHTAEGVAIGAGAGLLIGGIAEYQMRQRERSYYAPQPVVINTPATVLTTTPVINQTIHAPAPQQVVNHSDTGSFSPMSSANALFGR